MTTINDDDLMIIDTSLDQSVEVDAEWAIRKVRDTVAQALENKDVTIIERLCIQLMQVNKISGRALVELLYLWEKSWVLFGINENFVDYAYVRVGKHRHTVERYIKVARLLNEGAIPEDYQQEINNKNLNELIPIANAVNQGYEIDNSAWKRLAHATDAAEIREIVNKDVKNFEGRSNNTTLHMSREGYIYAYKPDQERRHVGYLELDNPDPIVQACIERIVSHSGIVKQ